MSTPKQPPTAGFLGSTHSPSLSDFDTVDGQFRHHLVGLLGSPSPDCPVVNVRAQVPLVIAARGASSSEQNGKLILTVGVPVTTALNVNYLASGKGTSWPACQVCRSTRAKGRLPFANRWAAATLRTA